MTSDRTFWANHFLIAMPTLTDPNFARTVTFVCEHNEQGAMGLVVNRLMELRLGEVLAHMQIKPGVAGIGDQRVYEGGPVHQERGFVLHTPEGHWESSLRVGDDLAVTTSRDVLAALAEGQGPENYLVALGFAGWDAGQLEQEVADNAWLTVPADREILYHTPVQERWHAAANPLGVDLDLVSGYVGHA